MHECELDALELLCRVFAEHLTVPAAARALQRVTGEGVLGPVAREVVREVLAPLRPLPRVRGYLDLRRLLFGSGSLLAEVLELWEGEQVGGVEVAALLRPPAEQHALELGDPHQQIGDELAQLRLIQFVDVDLRRATAHFAHPYAPSARSGGGTSRFSRRCLREA